MTQAFDSHRSESPRHPIRLHHQAASSVEPIDHPTPVEAPLNKALGLSPEPIPTPDRSSQIRAVSLVEASELPPIDEVPSNLNDRLAMARERLRQAGEHGMRIRVYEVALDLDMSEFHFARQFRAAYGCSPHVYYDEVRAARARDLLRQ
jgi:AraC-like DNA-binding protein